MLPQTSKCVIYMEWDGNILTNWYIMNSYPQYEEPAMIGSQVPPALGYPGEKAALTDFTEQAMDACYEYMQLTFPTAP